MSDFIPLSQPSFLGNESRYVQDCVQSGWVSSSGAYVSRFEEEMADYTGAKYAIATSSGTAALHLSLLVAGVAAGELVLVPNLTFVASANAVRYLGAEPVLVDANLPSWQMDFSLVQEFLDQACEKREGGVFHRTSNKRIAGILLVHVLGFMEDSMLNWVVLAKKWGIPLIEDAAEALGSRFLSKHAGTMGLLGCLSFNGNKLITCGGGGMVLTDSKELANRVRHLSTQAKSSKTDYEHDEVGYNYRLSNLHAALGLAQLEQLDSILAHQELLFQRYQQALPHATFPMRGAGVHPNYWLPSARFPDRKTLQQKLQTNQIGSRPLWIPMNQLIPYRNARYLSHFDHSRTIFSEALSLPGYRGLTEAQQDRVITVLRS